MNTALLMKMEKRESYLFLQRISIYSCAKRRIKIKLQLFPENENDFYIKDFNAQLSFNKDIQGKLNGLNFYIDAKEIFAKKK